MEKKRDETTTNLLKDAQTIGSDRDVFDLAAVLDLLGQDRELLKEVGDLFLEHLPRDLGRIQEAVTAGYAAEIAKAAHKLKGSLASLGAKYACEAALRLEIKGRHGDVTGAPEALADLELEIDRFVKAVKRAI